MSLPGGRYLISAQGDAEDDVFDAENLLVVVAGKPVVDGRWKTANLRFTPPGCWIERVDPIVQISLASCSTASAIKSVAVRPAK